MTDKAKPLYQQMTVTRDGDSLCVTGPGFTNLQESRAVFISPGSWQYAMLAPWVGVAEKPLIHLPWVELNGLARELGLWE